MKAEPKSGTSGRRKSKSKSRVKTKGRETIPRLFLWLDETLDDLEQRQLEGRGDRSSADNEKDARTMISLLRVYEKLVEMTDKQSHQKEHVPSDEAERICDELAERIARLQKQTGHKTVSSKSE